MDAVCGFSIVLLKGKAFIERDVVWMAAYVAKTCIYHNSINGAFTDVHVTHAMCPNAPLYHHEYWLLNCALITG